MKNLSRKLNLYFLIALLLFSNLCFADSSTIAADKEVSSVDHDSESLEQKEIDSSDNRKKKLDENIQNQKKAITEKSELDDLRERLMTYKNIPQIVEDKDYQAVVISLKDVSRIVCFTDISRVIYSKEKNLEIKTVGKNAFVKNLPKEYSDPLTGLVSHDYDSRPKEVYVVCGENTFSLLLIPKDIPANTIYLKSPYFGKEKAINYEKSNDYENMILKLIKSAYFEDIPEGYEIEDIDKLFKEYQEIRLLHRRNYKGMIFEVQEYIVIAKKEININEITLLEVISPKNPIAISIVTPLLKNNDQSRVFIVRLLKDE